MQTSLPGMDSIPESWEIDFVNQKFNFKSNKKEGELYIYRYSSLFIESIFLFLIFLTLSFLLMKYFFISIGVFTIFLYIFSPKYRYWFRNKFAWSLVKKKEIQKVKILTSNIKNKKFKIYFKNYYMDCIRYDDFVDCLEKVNCYQVFKSPVWCTEFIFKDNPKSGYMLLKYY